jgi:hypothetical protein
METKIFDFPSVLKEAQALFEARTKLPVGQKEQKNYCTQNGTPKFTLGIENNAVVCLWVGNFRKGRTGRPKKDGTCTVFSVADIVAPFRYTEADINEGFTPREWDRIGLELIYLHEQLK